MPDEELPKYEQAATHPCFATRTESQGVLYAGPLVLSVENDQYEGEGRFYVDRTKDARVRFDYKGDAPASLVFRSALSRDSITLTPSQSDALSFEIDITDARQELNPQEYSGLTFGRWSRKDLSATSATVCISNLRARMPGERVLLTEPNLGSRTVFELGSWTYTCDQHDDTTSGVHQLRISHVCSIRNSSAEPMSTDDVEESLRLLMAFLQLLQGGWLCVFGVTVQGDDGETIGWSNWCTHPHVGAQDDAMWAGTIQQDDVQRLAECFNSKYSDVTERRTLDDILYWRAQVYASAGSGEAKIVLGCIALEALCWLMLVEAGIVSESSMKKLELADAVSICLSRTYAGTEIPAECKSLASFAKAYGVSTGPATITRIRNAAVHYTSKNADILDALDHDAMMSAIGLAREYVDAILIEWFGYDGNSYKRYDDWRSN